MNKVYTTFHIQKSKLVTLGTCVHIFLDCPSLKSTKARLVSVEGDIRVLMPKCNWCFERLNKRTK